MKKLQIHRHILYIICSVLYLPQSHIIVSFSWLMVDLFD